MILGIVSFFFVVLAAILFYDVAPYQLGSVCTINDDPNCPDQFFSEGYFQGREKFCQAAMELGASLSRHTVHTEYGIDYTMDVAVVEGHTDAVFIHTSGTHGVEGFVGSALQVKLLRDLAASKTKPAATIVFVHAVNPYGFANLLRFNEHNVDLNRNDLDPEEWKKVLTREPNEFGYEDVKEVFLSSWPRPYDRYVFLLKLVWLILKKGFTPLKTGFVVGQYHDPNGVFYGGARRERSVTLLHDIVKKHATGKKFAMILHVHSGLGPSGVDTMMVENEHDELIAKGAFPTARIEANTKGDKAYEHVEGVFSLARFFSNATVLQIAEEFGTVNPLSVARALILENAARNFAPGTEAHRAAKQWLREAFAPASLAWKSSCLAHGTTRFFEALTFFDRK